MPAQLITRFKDVTADGGILELVIWKVPEPVPPTDHGDKYRAVYVVDGICTGQLTQKRWDLVRVAQGKGELTIRELASYIERDVKRVHEDIGILTNLGLLERAESGRVMCPYTSMHIDMYLKAA
jgi:hypothetical protein